MSDDTKLPHCFLPGPTRLCISECMAYVEDGKTCCRLLNVIEKLVPLPTRPVAPTSPLTTSTRVK